jgi:ribosomal protein L24
MQYPEDHPLLEIRALLATNEKLIRVVVEGLKDTTLDTKNLSQNVAIIEGQLMVIHSRLDRIDKDAEEEKDERLAQRQMTHSQSWMIWGALLAAILAVVVPLVIRPGANYSPSVSTPTK